MRRITRDDVTFVVLSVILGGVLIGDQLGNFTVGRWAAVT